MNEKEIERLQGIEKRLKEAKLSQCAWEDDEDIVLLDGEPIGMTISKHNREFDRWWDAVKKAILGGCYFKG